MRTFPANINADDPGMVARSKYVLSQFGTLSENCALMVNGRVAGGSAITVARRKSTRQFLHYQRF
jgi:ribulose-bisphosphate carboxylase large chain